MPEDASEPEDAAAAVDTEEPEPQPDAFAGRVCSWSGCEAPAAGGRGRGVICREHQLELNRRVSAGKTRTANRAAREAAAKPAAPRRPKRKPPREPEQPESLQPVARRLVPAARRVDHAFRAYREALERASEAERELRAAREGWRALLAQVDARAEDVPAGDRP